jgi:hypothetical protein
MDDILNGQRAGYEHWLAGEKQIATLIHGSTNPRPLEAACQNTLPSF